MLRLFGASCAQTPGEATSAVCMQAKGRGGHRESRLHVIRHFGSCGEILCGHHGVEGAAEWGGINPALVGVRSKRGGQGDGNGQAR
jgi:hypothetical protein